MNYFKIIPVFMFLAICNLLCAQDSIPKILSKIALSINYKESVLISGNDFKTQSRDFFMGYKIKNKFIIGISSGNYTQFNADTKEFNNYNQFGVGFKYQFLFEKRYLNKKFVVEPFLNINDAISNVDEDNFYSYDIGVNIIYPKAPYFYFGTGIMQNFYNSNIDNLFSWYFSFGIRL